MVMAGFIPEAQGDFCACLLKKSRKHSEMYPDRPVILS